VAHKSGRHLLFGLLIIEWVNHSQTPTLGGDGREGRSYILVGGANHRGPQPGGM